MRRHGHVRGKLDDTRGGLVGAVGDAHLSEDEGELFGRRDLPRDWGVESTGDFLLLGKDKGGKGCGDDGHGRIDF